MKKTVSFILLFLLLFEIYSTAVSEQEGGKKYMNHVFTNETLHECNPYTFNVEKAAALGLAHGDAFTDEYFSLQAYYCEALWNWLCVKADLCAVDDEIGKSEMRFIVRTEYRTIYQENQSFGTKYLYIRSNMMIENLNRDDIDTLRVLCEKGNASSEQVMQFVEETWLRVITQNTDYPGETITIHDMNTGRRVANCSLILGIDTMFELDSEGMMIDVEHEHDKSEFLGRLAKALGEELTDIFGIPVEVIIHG